MKRRGLQFITASAIMLIASALFAETAYYVQSARAKVMSGLSFKSEVIAEVNKGTRLLSTGREGNWVKVVIGDREGYVPSLLLSTQPPLNKTEVIKAEDDEIKQGVRRRASSYTSSAAARGLAQEDRKRLGREEQSDYQALEKMESFSVSSDEVNRFREEGK